MDYPLLGNVSATGQVSQIVQVTMKVVRIAAEPQCEPVEWLLVDISFNCYYWTTQFTLYKGTSSCPHLHDTRDNNLHQKGFMSR